MSELHSPSNAVTESDALVVAEDTKMELIGCWSTCGVYGDNTCPELLKFVHCRNCPVYSAAGARLIDRPLPPDYRKEWTRHFAAERRLPDSSNASAILFRIQNDWLALPTHGLLEVAEHRLIHSLPHRREGMVLGLANVRGELVTCISLGHVLQIQGIPSLAALRADYTRLLVIQWEDSRLGFPVDDVQGPHRFPATELTDVSDLVTSSTPCYVQARLKLPEHTAGLLDPQILFSNLERALA